mgnify:FL=1
MNLKKPFFWDEINLLAIFLYPLSLITYFVNIIKKISNKKKFDIKSICIGNIYVGGTGKTPLTIKINNILKKKYKTVFIKKEYTNQIDEQNLLKFNGNLICSNNRFNAISAAERKNYDLVILDDGLQDKSINYDISIACFNSTDCIGNGLLIPSGPLRENISEIKNYDAVFLNGEKKNKKFSNYLKSFNNNLYIFDAKYVPLNLKSFSIYKNYLLFCGIGNPLEFERTLKKYKFKIKEKFIFPDHYKFSKSEIDNFKNIAKLKKLDIITTEKDYLRLNNKDKKNIKFLKVELKVQNEHDLIEFLNKSL